MRDVARAAVLALAALGACGDDDDAHVAADASLPADAAPGDARPVDASMSDAAPADGGRDASSPDAAPPAGPSLAWAVRFGGAASENPLAVAVDASGDVYVAGLMLGSFDAGDFHLEYAGGSLDGFVMRVAHADGSVVWARAIGGAGQDWIRGIAVAPDGDVVVLGQFEETIDVGTGPLTAHGPAPGGSTDMLLAKLRASDGGTIWARGIGGAGYEGTGDLAVHTDGTICVSGDLYGATDFGGGPIGSDDVAALVACFDDTGAYRWAHTFAESLGGAAMGLALTSGGDLVTSLVTIPGAHGFVGSFAGAGGDARWSSDLAPSVEVALWTVATDRNDRVYAGGSLSGSLDFAGATRTADHAPVVLAYAPDGTPRDALLLGGGGGGEYRALATAADGTLVAVGHVNGTIVAGDTTHVLQGPSAAFVIAYAGDGSVAWSRSFDGAMGASAGAAAVDAQGAIVVAGAIDGSVDFGGTTLTSAGDGDIFVARLVP